MKLVRCIKCNWCHFEVSKAYAEEEVASFNTYFGSLSKDDQDKFYGGNKSSIRRYMGCGLCGGSYKNFKDSEDDGPLGSTIGPIINRNE